MKDFHIEVFKYLNISDKKKQEDYLPIIDDLLKRGYVTVEENAKAFLRMGAW